MQKALPISGQGDKHSHSFVADLGLAIDNKEVKCVDELFSVKSRRPLITPDLDVVL